MSTEIQIGDLVCLFRRKRPGIGIVLRRSADIFEKLGVDLEKELQKKACSPPSKPLEVSQLLDVLDSRYNINDKDLINSIYLFNAGWNTKTKTQFVFIKWLQRPSNYDMNEIRREEEWFPSEWVKTLKTTKESI